MSVIDVFKTNQEEALNKDGHQKWHRLVLNDLGAKHSEAVIQQYETWSECPDPGQPAFRGLRGEGDREVNRIRAARRAKRSIRFACKTAEFDRMITLTTKDNYNRQEMQRMVGQFIKLVREATAGKINYIVVPERHDSDKTSPTKKDSHHVHIAVCGRQDYKLLVSIWHYRICKGRGFVHVSNPINKHTDKAVWLFLFQPSKPSKMVCFGLRLVTIWSLNHDRLGDRYYSLYALRANLRRPHRLHHSRWRN